MRARHIGTMLVLGVGLSACRTSAPRVTGPTLPLSTVTAEALGMKELPPRVAAMHSNRAWSTKPGLLRALVDMKQAISTPMRLDKQLEIKLVVVTSAINQCLY